LIFANLVWAGALTVGATVGRSGICAGDGGRGPDVGEVAGAVDVIAVCSGGNYNKLKLNKMPKHDADAHGLADAKKPHFHATNVWEDSDIFHR
jgi:hypothetical protein